MSIEFVIVGGHAAKLLEAAEQPLNGVALGIAVHVIGSRLVTLASGRNHGVRTPHRRRGYQRVGGVSAVGDKIGQEQRQGLRGVAGYARRKLSDVHGPGRRSPCAACSSARRGCVRGLTAHFFVYPARVLVSPHGGRVRQECVQGVVLLHGVEHALPHTCSSLVLEAKCT